MKEKNKEDMSTYLILEERTGYKDGYYARESAIDQIAFMKEEYPKGLFHLVKYRSGMGPMEDSAYNRMTRFFKDYKELKE